MSVLSLHVVALEPRRLTARVDRMGELTPREREILALMALGYSNAGMCQELFLSTKTIESHVRSIFMKLDVPSCGYTHRRVLAVLAHLGVQSQVSAAA